MIKIKEEKSKDSIVKSSFTVGSMTFISRISGFLRDVIFASYFGAGSSTDAFFVAFKIPNFFRRLFAEGAFIQSFVPVLNDYKVNRQQDLKKFISYVQGNLGFVLIIIVSIGIIFSDQVIGIFAPGFEYSSQRFNLSSNMLEITFSYLFFISLTAMSAGIFNTYNKFLLPSITPVLLNVSLIMFAIFVSGLMQEPIMSLAYGVLVAGILQYLIQIPSLIKMDLFVLPRISLKFEGVNRVLKLMLPAMLGTAVVQINLMIDSIVASLLVSGSISWLYYSDRLVELPLGVFGIAIATVILPKLSEKYSKNSMFEYSEMIRRALKIALVFSLPAMFGLLILAKHVISALFQYGNFEMTDTLMSSLSLITYAVGLPAFILMKVLLAGFFSRQDTLTPVKYGAVAVVFNIIINISVILYYMKNPFPGAHALLALATSMSAWLQVILLYRRLLREGIVDKNCFLHKDFFKSLFSSIFMSLLLILLLPELNKWVSYQYYFRGLYILAYVTLGALTYFLLMKILKANFRQMTYGNN